MISDLELVDDDPRPPGRETPGSGTAAGKAGAAGDGSHGRDGGDGADGADGGDRDALARLRPWLWACGGALAASAVWGAWAYAESQAVPDLRGYRVSRELCEDAKLSALRAAYGEPEGTGSHQVDVRPEVEHAVCTVDLTHPRAEGENAAAYASVQLAYTRHKVTDPEPEFDASITSPTPGYVTDHRARRVTGLGERAYFLTDVEGEGRELRVLDGQVELSLVVNGVVSGEEDPVTGELKLPEAVDLSGSEPLMVEDMKDLMATLKK
ncbi:hypothetical protein [Streptomyces liangshanensis]|uniref:Uncharacterized protein n=1 Tax=Streptomyces liangshanensis TaxID=2717324 RepID=A0A6G9GXG0_9ACTN|nr:hypothetical protein [Streptomyces liangshanensis]QIQ02904.1 hypothetical protein HA039_11705 [Streptomyces liangshanensis]